MQVIMEIRGKDKGNGWSACSYAEQGPKQAGDSFVEAPFSGCMSPWVEKGVVIFQGGPDSLSHPRKRQ